LSSLLRLLARYIFVVRRELLFPISSFQLAALPPSNLALMPQDIIPAAGINEISGSGVQIGEFVIGDAFVYF
jgi:hypothetical protein